MASFNKIQTNFMGGEIAPDMWGRVDDPRVQNGAAKLVNMIPLIGGGVERLPGTEMVASSVDSVTFGQNGVLGDWADAMFMTTSAGEDFLFMPCYRTSTETALRVMQWSITNELWVSPTNISDFIHYRRDYAETGSDAWSLAPTIGQMHRRYVVAEDPSESAGYERCIFTTALGDGITKIWQHSATEFRAKQAIHGTYDGDAVDEMTLGAITEYQGRLAVTKKGTMRVLISTVADSTYGYSYFDTGSNDDDAMDFTINSEKSHEIRWMRDNEQLLVGGNRSEFILQSAGGGAITPSSIIKNEITDIGCTIHGGAELAGDRVVIPRISGGIVEWFWSNGLQAYQSKPLSDHVSHIFATSVLDIAFQEHSPYGPILWVVTAPGNLWGMVYRRELGTTAWFRFKHGGGGTIQVRGVHSFTTSDNRAHTMLFLEGSSPWYNSGFQGSVTQWIEEFSWPKIGQIGAYGFAAGNHYISRYPSNDPTDRSASIAQNYLHGAIKASISTPAKILDFQKSSSSDFLCYCDKALVEDYAPTEKYRIMGMDRYPDPHPTGSPRFTRNQYDYYEMIEEEGYEHHLEGHDDNDVIDTEWDEHGNLGYLLFVYDLYNTLHEKSPGVWRPVRMPVEIGNWGNGPQMCISADQTYFPSLAWDDVEAGDTTNTFWMSFTFADTDEFWAGNIFVGYQTEAYAETIPMTTPTQEMGILKQRAVKAQILVDDTQLVRVGTTKDNAVVQDLHQPPMQTHSGVGYDRLHAPPPVQRIVEATVSGSKFGYPTKLYIGTGAEPTNSWTHDYSVGPLRILMVVAQIEGG